MVKKNLFLENIDLFFSGLLLIFLIFSNYRGWVTIFFIPEHIFFQGYLIVFGVVLAVLTIFLSLDEKLFYVLDKRNFRKLTFNMFKFPLIASVLGFLLTLLNQGEKSIWFFFINVSILLYVILSCFELFKFIFNITYGIKIKKAEKELEKN